MNPLRVMTASFLLLGLLFLAVCAHAQPPGQLQVWTCTAGQPLGSGHWSAAQGNSPAEFCTGTCGSTPTGWVAGSCKLPADAAPTDTVHASVDAGATNTWLLKTNPALGYGTIIGANVTKVFSWTAPTQNEDGTALTDLAGYNFYESVVAGAPMAKINSALLTGASYTASLLPGSYQFAVTALNKAGSESVQSVLYALVIPAAPAIKPAAPGGLTSR